jgi:hypothetical protein
MYKYLGFLDLFHAISGGSMISFILSDSSLLLVACARVSDTGVGCIWYCLFHFFFFFIKLDSLHTD